MDNASAHSDPFEEVLLGAEMQATLRTMTLAAIIELAPSETPFITPLRVAHLTQLTLAKQIEQQGEGAAYGLNAGKLLSRIIVPMLVDALREYYGGNSNFSEANVHRYADYTLTPLNENEYSTVAIILNRVLQNEVNRTPELFVQLQQTKILSLQQRLKTQTANLALAYDKHSELERAFILTGDPSQRFQLKHELEDLRSHIRNLETEQTTLERQLSELHSSNTQRDEMNGE